MQSRTPPDPATGGMILGTLPYMAPEQLEGKETDARTDIFAFGAVLSEMITGQKAFQGESQASLVAAILEHDPPQIISRERMTPLSVERLVKVCLAKNPDDRWQSARDLCRELQWIADSVAAGESASPATPIPGSRGGQRTWFLAGGFAVILLLGLLPALLYFLRVPSQAPAVRFEMSAPGIIGAPVISPDGQQIAYVANTDGKNAIWVRPIGAVAARPLSGTENAGPSMFWSPDNRYLGFFADRKLKKIDLSNGFVTELANWWFQNGGTWNRNGDILIRSETSKSGGIFRVSDAGGTLTQITEADRSGKQLSVHQYPQFLPDGRHFLYHATGSAGYEALAYLGSLDSKSTTRLATLPDFSSLANEGMKYGAGYLLFRRDNTLMAQAFDVKRLALEGDPMTLVENINGGFSVSENAVLVYQRAGDSVQQSATQLLWFDRRGNPGGQVTAPANIDTIQLSPEGRRVAVTTNARFTDLSDVWVVDLSDGVATKLNADNPYWDGYGIWSPDGSRIIFSSGRAGHPLSMYQQFSNGNGKAELLLQTVPHREIGMGITFSSDAIILTRFMSTICGFCQCPAIEGRNPIFHNRVFQNRALRRNRPSSLPMDDISRTSPTSRAQIRLLCRPFRIRRKESGKSLDQAELSLDGAVMAASCSIWNPMENSLQCLSKQSLLSNSATEWFSSKFHLQPACHHGFNATMSVRMANASSWCLHRLVPAKRAPPSSPQLSIGLHCCVENRFAITPHQTPKAFYRSDLNFW
jgi:hypothetical protein